MSIGNNVTMEEAAEILKVSVRRVTDFRKDGRLNPVGRVGRAWLFDKSAVTKLAKKKRVPGRKKQSEK